MALFGPYDAENVPLVNQFCQVNADLTVPFEESEMVVWHNRYGAYDHEVRAKFIQEHGREPIGLHAASYGDLIGLHVLTMSIMGHGADTGRVKAADIDKLNAMMKDFRTQNIDMIHIINRIEDSRQFFSGEFYLDDIFPLRTSFNPAFSLVLQDLSERLLQRQHLQRCPECHSPFFSERRGVLYCSRRCAARVGERRRRRERNNTVSKTGK